MKIIFLYIICHYYAYIYDYISWTEWCSYLLSIKDDEHEKNIPKEKKNSTWA